MIRNGLIGAIGGAGASSSSSLALSDGLACYTQSFSGIINSSFAHNLGTTDVVVEFRDQDGNFLVPDNWTTVNNNSISVEFPGSTQGSVTIIGCIESGLAPITGGVTTVEGLSGIIDLDCPDDSVTITTSGQVINICSLFTPTSGALLEQKCRDIDILSGLILSAGGGGGAVSTLNGISGAITLTSPDDSVNINVNGQEIELTTPNSGAPSGASYLLRNYDDNGHLTSARILNAVSGVRLQDFGARSNSGLVVTLDFDDEPVVGQVLTWNGNLLAWENIDADAGQTSVNGLSGVVTLTSNPAIEIITSGQTLILSGIFTPASGAVLEQKCRDVNTLSGFINEIISDAGQTSINGLSGVVTIDAVNNGINVNVNGQSIELSTLFTYTSGQIIDQKCEDIATISGVANSATQKAEKYFTSSSGLEFVLEHSLQTTAWVATMWRTDGIPEELLIPHNIYPSGVDHAVVTFQSSDSAPSGYTGRVVFVG